MIRKVNGKWTLNEASYTGNLGFMELIKFHSSADSKQKQQMKSRLKNNPKKVRKLLNKVAGVKLHKIVGEEQEFVSKAGAGEDGRHEVVCRYVNDTPGQVKPRHLKKFKEFAKEK